MEDERNLFRHEEPVVAEIPGREIEEALFSVREDPAKRSMSVASVPADALESAIAGHIIAAAGDYNGYDDTPENLAVLSDLLKAMRQAEANAWDSQTGMPSSQRVELTGLQVATAYEFVKDRISDGVPQRPAFMQLTSRLVRNFPDSPVVVSERRRFRKLLDAITGHDM